MKVVHVCTGAVRQVRINGRSVASAIAKQPVAGPVAVKPLGLEGDEQADLTVHGGLAKAVYAYPAEHLPFWRTVRAQARVGCLQSSSTRLATPNRSAHISVIDHSTTAIVPSAVVERRTCWSFVKTNTTSQRDTATPSPTTR